MNILVTGCAGFIGFHVVQKLINQKHKVIGIDMINSYYDIKLKKKRLQQIIFSDNKKLFSFHKFDISNASKLQDIFSKNKIDIVINLAAQAGVRDSISNPDIYLSFNIKGRGSLSGFI